MNFKTPYTINGIKIIETFGNLEKGTYISPDDIAVITGFKLGDSKYKLALTNIKNLVKSKTKHLGYTIRIKDYGVKILLDSDASVYNHNTFGKGYKTMGKSYEGMVNVDVKNLNKEKKKIHTQNMITQYQMLNAATKAALKNKLKEGKNIQLLLEGNKVCS